MQDVMAPVVAGALQAAQLAQQIKTAMLQEQELRRQVEREERQARLDDIWTRTILEVAGRPVVGGTVGEVLYPPRIGNMPEELAAPYEVRRKPKASRTVSHKTLSGQELQYELLTPEERHERQTAMATAEKRALREAEKVDLPGYGEVHPSLIPFFSGQARIGSEEAIAALNRLNQRDIQRTKDEQAAERTLTAATSREKVAKITAASRETVAGMRARPTTPQPQRPPLATNAVTLREIEKDEAKVYGRMRELGEILAPDPKKTRVGLNWGKKVMILNRKGEYVESELTPALWDTMNREYRVLERTAEGLRNQKEDLLRSMGRQTGEYNFDPKTGQLVPVR